ncbi:hypothetical protein HYV82_05400 [Candidatus Woesearchaeota archaeon]|nr:hypothetical protein [Candidatus Woesearchaeota archaeon]
MKRNLAPGEARRILSRVPANVSFWLCTNEQLARLEALGSALQRVSDDVFRYHVNRDKNDFEAWIRDVISDRELAREISRIKTKDTLIRKISERVEELKEIVDNAKAARKANARLRSRKRAKRTVSGRKKGRRKAAKKSKRRAAGKAVRKQKRMFAAAGKRGRKAKRSMPIRRRKR